MVSRKKQSIVFTIALVVASNAWSWESGTHKLIQSLAYKQLTPSALEFVAPLVGQPAPLQWLNLDDQFYQRRIDPSANWERGLDLNLMPRADSTFEPDKHCPKRDCLVAGVLSAYRVLQDPARSQAEHQRALQFFVVLTARLHQPLNAGFTEDQGGRLVVVPFGDTDVNLRWIWEQGMYLQAGGDWQILSAQWQMPDALPEFTGMMALDWLADARTIAVDQVYLASLDAKWPSIARRYDDLWQQQVSLAAYRIAQAVNALADNTLLESK